jgi:hypothetical protein
MLRQALYTSCILFALVGIRRYEVGWREERRAGMETKFWGGIPARASRAAIAGIVAFLLLMVGLAGCALNANVTVPTPVATDNISGTPGTHATLTLPTLTAVASPSGPGGTGGAKEFCSKPPDVSIHPDTNVPVYPGAVLHFSQANGTNAFYGYCTSGTTSDVQNYYAQQLRSKGWSGLKTATIATVVQITAIQCASQNPPQIIVTIAPDTTGTTTTSVSIVMLAGAC